MLKKLSLAAVAAATLALGAPAAHAAVAAADCGFESVSTSTAGSDDPVTYTGALYAYAAFDDQSTHTVRCWIQVDGEAVAWTPETSGTGFVAASGPATYQAYDWSTVESCLDVDGAVSCEGTTVVQVPPGGDPDLVDFVIRTVAELLDTTWPGYGEIADSVVCPVLASLSPGLPGVVDITPEGDTTLAVVGPFWDCPPYGDLFPPS